MPKLATTQIEGTSYTDMIVNSCKQGNHSRGSRPNFSSSDQISLVIFLA